MVATDVSSVAGRSRLWPRRALTALAGAGLVAALGLGVGMWMHSDDAAPSGVNEGPSASMMTDTSQRMLPSLIVGDRDSKMYVAGVEVQPGTYRGGGAISGTCSWELTDAGDGNFNKPMARGSSNGEPMYVTIRQGQLFTTQGCVGWTKQ